MQMTDSRIKWLKNLLNNRMCGWLVKKPGIKPCGWLQGIPSNGMANQTRCHSNIQMFSRQIIKRIERISGRVNTISTGYPVNRPAYQPYHQLYVQPIN